MFELRQAVQFLSYFNSNCFDYECVFQFSTEPIDM